MNKTFEFDSRLQHPFGAYVAGPSQSGKSQFIFKLLRVVNEFVCPPPERIIWFYGSLHDCFKEFPSVEFVEGLPSENFDNLLDGRRTLIVIDDLMSETDVRVTKLFTKFSHHKDASVIYVSQNLFHKGKENRTISLNAHYIVLFKNPRDSSQAAHLGSQMFPGKAKFFAEVFEDATRRPHGYLFVDLKPGTPQELRLRTRVFPGEENYVYLPK
jgi:hypothetical protein